MPDKITEKMLKDKQIYFIPNSKARCEIKSIDRKEKMIVINGIKEDAEGKTIRRSKDTPLEIKEFLDMINKDKRNFENKAEAEAEVKAEAGASDPKEKEKAEEKKPEADPEPEAESENAGNGGGEPGTDIVPTEVVEAEAEPIGEKDKPKPGEKPEYSIKKTSQKLPVSLNDEECRAAGKELGELHKLFKAKEAEMKSVAKTYKAELAELDAKINPLSDKVITGEEYVDVPVEIRYFWDRNEKVSVRMDTEEVIKRTAIPKEEMQTFMDNTQ